MGLCKGVVFCVVHKANQFQAECTGRLEVVSSRESARAVEGKSS